MMLLALALSFAAAAAAQSPSLDSILNEPIALRVRTLRPLGRRAYGDLAKIAFDKQNQLKTRWRAVTTMGRLDPGYFRASLDRALISPDWFMRNAALIALLGDDHARAVAASLKALDDSALIVRTQAVRNIIHLKARVAEPRLWRELNAPRAFSAKHESLWVRAHLAEALASFSGPGRTKSFQKLLNDEDPRLHKWAIRGLEASTGMRLTERGEPISLARAKWLARLGLGAI